MEANNFKNFVFKKPRLVIFIILISLPSILLLSFKNVYRGNDLEVSYLDVGQGDSILIKSPNGINFLIDTGSNKETSQKIEKELSFLNKEIDGLLLTHPDSDHSGGFFDIKNTLKVKDLIISSENNYSEYIKDKNINVSHVNNESKLMLDSNIESKILSPYANMNGTENGKSIVNTINYGNMNFIFMGDADSETERKLVSLGYFDKNINKNTINILKVGHHGSDTSSSLFFLKKIKPEYCIISVGKENRYNHPTKNALDRLEKHCKYLYRTDLNGNVQFKTNGKFLKIKTEK